MSIDNDRINGPAISSIRSIPLPEFKIHFLDNGVPVYYINEGSQELLKLDVVFNGGRLAETQKTQSRSIGAMLKEGTSNYTGEQLSTFFDYHGASYNSFSSMDFTTITLFSLTKHFPKLISRFSDIVFEPSFPSGELDKLVKNSIQRLQMDKAKNDIVAYRNITEKVFGKEGKYGYNSTVDTYKNLTRNTLLSYYEEMISTQSCTLFLSGKFDTSTFDVLNQHFGKWNYKGNYEPNYPVREFEEGNFFFDSPNKLQSAIRIGRHFGNRKHEDFSKLSFLSNVFGGFFGSRLMKNIREDKGYTYNIYSDLDTMLHDGYFYIATELAGKHVEPGLEEIFKEMRNLQENLIPEAELNMNKNYILGNLLNSLDGPFQSIRIIKSTILNDQTKEDLEGVIRTFANITAEELRETAIKYLNPSDYTQVIVGGR